MTLYTDLRDGAVLTLLASYGTTATLRQNAASYDPTTGVSTNTSTDTTIKVVRLSAQGRTDFRIESVARAKFMFIVGGAELAAAGVTPNVNDKIVYSGKTYAIVEINEIAPDGTAVIYKILVED